VAPNGMYSISPRGEISRLMFGILSSALRFAGGPHDGSGILAGPPWTDEGPAVDQSYVH
jgi:hypothetical protein